jgi:hypothetical protein
MQIPLAKMASQQLLDLGRYHLAAVGQADSTRALVAALGPTLDALAAAKAAREQAEQALIAPRVAARFAEYALDSVLREIASLARTCDNKAGGDLVFRALFPNGLDAEVRPRGATQLAAASALRSRLDSQPAASVVKAQALAELDAAVANLTRALDARKSAERALAAARATEDGAREAFVSGYDSNAGAIRQMFPRNRARQDLHFDQFRSDQGADDGGDGGGGDVPQPAPAVGQTDAKTS